MCNKRDNNYISYEQVLEPEQEPSGAGEFRWSWSRNFCPAPAPP